LLPQEYRDEPPFTRANEEFLEHSIFETFERPSTNIGSIESYKFLAIPS
jgi:hypothetical protein